MFHSLPGTTSSSGAAHAGLAAPLVGPTPSKRRACLKVLDATTTSWLHSV